MKSAARKLLNRILIYFINQPLFTNLPIIKFNPVFAGANEYFVFELDFHFKYLPDRS